MKDTTKKEIKDIMEVLGCMALSSVIVFGVNGWLRQVMPSRSAQPKKSEQVVAKPDTIASTRDSIMMLNKTHTR